MSTYIETANSQTLPCIKLSGIVAFPGLTVNCELSDPIDKKAAGYAQSHGTKVFLTTIRPDSTKRDSKNLYAVGVIATVKQIVNSPDGITRCVLFGESRAVVSSYTQQIFLKAEVVSKHTFDDETDVTQNNAIVHLLIEQMQLLSAYLPKFSTQVMATVRSMKNAGTLSDFIASNILRDIENRQEVLELFDPIERGKYVLNALMNEVEIVKTEFNIRDKVKQQMDRNQREYYLREQMKAIEDELGIEDDEDILEYNKKIVALGLEHDIEEKLLKDVKKLAKSPYSSAESAVLRNYLDTVLEIPWGIKTPDYLDIKACAKKLDKDHYGLQKVKRRILEYLAVRTLNPNIKNQIICLVGPPGVGKTSIAASLAEAMKRKYVRVSLGGVKDESDIRGHRKTYVAAMPGRIVTALIQAKCTNPLILLDEIDKMGNDMRGDPASAMLEVLDGEQNKAFRDHFTEIPIDLSDCIFICTANSLDTVPRPLIDRMEIIRLDAYTVREKLAIAKKHLIPKQRSRHGLTSKNFKIDDSALLSIIDSYTAEAGVRTLERYIASVMRRAAMRISEGEAKVTVKEADLTTMLDAHKIAPELISETDEIGVVNGLAYTAVGGDLLKIEVSVLNGSGAVKLTGSLGNVMKESAEAAISYIRSVSDILKIDPDFYKTKDIHIHVPEGAVPKDGPSAGVTIMTALVSELTKTPVHRDVAMTGEITLRGRVLAIGGLKEKTAAAYRAGVKTVLIPADNSDDLKDIDPEVRENLRFIPCRCAEDVLSAALLRSQGDSDDTIFNMNSLPAVSETEICV